MAFLRKWPLTARTGREMVFVLFLCWITSMVGLTEAQWSAHTYWNDRYGSEPGWVKYVLEDTRNGFWSDDSGVRDKYGYPTGDYSGQSCSGCTCDTVERTVTQCSGSSITLKGHNFYNISADTFTSTNVREIKIFGCLNFDYIYDGTFDKLTSLETLIIQYTKLHVFPDVSTTSIQTLNLANNKVKFYTANNTRLTLPNTLTRVALMNNKIDWIPPRLFSGTNVRILALDGNQLKFFPTEAVRNADNVIYLGISSNQLKSLSSRNMEVLSTNLQHLNISNNALTYIEQGALSSLKTAKILELHQNSFSKLEVGMIENMANLLHLDLNNNKLKTLTSKALSDLPKLITLRLHSQKDPNKLSAIAYDAFNNIGTSLKYLWLSEGLLPNFPHQVLAEGSYPVIDTIWIDSNAITSVITFGPEAYTIYLYNYFLAKNASYVPFSTVTNLKILYLGHNQLSELGETDLCQLVVLQELHLEGNLLTEDTIPTKTFECNPALKLLSLSSNRIQYVPTAIKSASLLPSITELFLENNKLTFLNEGFFSNLTTLQILKLGSNSIISIEDGTFPENIRTIYLANNDFRFLHEHPFTNLTSLVELQLQHNKITHIPDTAFQGCISLGKLYLSRNQIGRLNVAHLRDNPLNNGLYLDNNDIGYIEDGTFSHISTILELNLYNNKLTTIPMGGDFNDLTVSTDLNFENNRITSLLYNVFKALNCRNLNLKNNKISEIKSYAFNSVSTSQDLSLTGNPLRTIESNAFNSTSHKTINMQDMDIGNLPARAFKSVSIAGSLNLQNNKIKEIAVDAFSTVSVGKDMRLDSNTLELLHGKVFGDGSSVGVKLHMNQNQLVSLPPDAFQGVTLQQLTLEDNRLVLYPGAALSNQNLQKILMARNQISEIPLGSFSSSQSAMVEMDFSENKIKVLPNTLLDPLINLRKIYLQKNLLERVDAEVFNAINDSLLEVYLHDNQLTWLPRLGHLHRLRTLDLSNNHIEVLDYHAFSHFNPHTLTALKLSNNPLSCDCYTYETLEHIASSVTGAVCASRPAVVGTTFDKSSKTDPKYFNKQDKSGFLCSGYNIQASAPIGYQILVEWTSPSVPYPSGSIIAGQQWVYNVTCVSDWAVTVQGNLTTNSSTTMNTSSLSVLLAATDGVTPGVDYTCSLSLSQDGVVSGPTPPVFVTTTTVLFTGNDTVESKDYRLEVALYDFSVSHPDFSGVSTATFSRPTYIPSPYGAWLAISNTPTADTFSHWFRSSASVNKVFYTNLTLRWQEPTATNRYWKDNWYPLDGLGYLQQGQRDCTAQLHNFGFTAAIRAGFRFDGTGMISVGGGDELWVYVNKVLLLEVTSSAGDVNAPCKSANISATAATGGGRIIPYSGVVVNGQCVATTPQPGEAVTLDLLVGDSYHLDVFVVERKPCRSRLFLDTQSIHFVQSESDDPAMDYFVTLAEDVHIDAISAEMTLTDAFSIGPSYSVSIVKGNEARHFTIKQDTAAHRAAAVAPTINGFLNSTTLPGLGIDFLECSTAAVVLPEPNEPGIESFTIASQVALLTVNFTLDYEVAQRYVVVLEVVDTAAVPDRTGQIVVRILVSDVNDNCPVLDQTTFSIEPVPTLQAQPIIFLNATDADSAANGEIGYYAAATDVEPPLSRYNSTLYLYNIVYKESSTIVFKLAAIDGGSPRRGATVDVRIKLKNSCLLDVLLQPIRHQIIVGETNGSVSLRIPRYWIYDYECQRDAGMQAGYILDDKLSASSYMYGYWPGRGRLNGSYGWIPMTQDTSQWMGVDFSSPYRLTSFIIQGAVDSWVTRYRLLYSNDGANFTTYVNASGTSEFDGNSDVNSTLIHVLDPPIMARYVRISPRAWSTRIALRVDFVGCTQAEKKYYETSCERCETTWYCTGDGLRRPCGRCVGQADNQTCQANPLEHSFGAAETCSPCPKGWTCMDGYATPCRTYRYSTCNATWCPTERSCDTTVTNRGVSLTSCDYCSWCEPGSACQGGVRTVCGPGTYSDGRQTSCLMCKPGTYQNESSSTDCKTCPNGYTSSSRKHRCSACAANSITYGNGTAGCATCAGPVQCACMATPSPCAKGVECVNTEKDGTSFSCGPCPPGYTGDGRNCTDIDECTVYEPCWDRRCVNTEPGYQCLHCPAGYTGTYEDGAAIDINKRVFLYTNQEHAPMEKQICTDVDECATGEDKCNGLAACVNTVGSYTCGHCKKGYLGSSLYGCYSDNYCTTGNHNCGTTATCIYVGPGVFRCECPVGYAGDGQFCGTDQDMDGHPDKGLLCANTGCRPDKCPFVPDSGQEDTDVDNVGDVCDVDDDNDSIMDEKDNCQYRENYAQTDTDTDGVGDLCDNCVNVANPDQVDTDRDGQGDACDADDDNDGVLDGSDNCPRVANPGQENTMDSDSVGDACDNCPTVNNNDQADVDQNGAGDACVLVGGTDIDGDGDSVANIMDNCPLSPNPDQTDTDSDGEGDACDSDLDGDGVSNDADNCPYVTNGNQLDLNGDTIGDACAIDSDGDGVSDDVDVCPYLRSVHTTSLTGYTSVTLYPDMSNTSDPRWEVTHGGAQIRQLINTNMPSMLIGPQAVSSVDYYGTWFVNTDQGQGYIGCVFAYHSNRRFYVLMWRHDNLNFNGNNYIGGVKGLQLKVVNSNSGPGESLANALWLSSDTTNEATMLWHEPTMLPWKHKTAYRWHVKHRPSIGLIRIKVYEGSSMIVDSGAVYDTTLAGGRVGVFVFGQHAPIWSNLVYRCAARENYALSLDGTDGSVRLETVTQLRLNDSFTLGAWISLDSSYVSGTMPVICTLDTRLCLSVEDGHATGKLGDMVANGNTSLPVDHWCHLVLRYEAQTETLSVFINGSSSGPEAQTTSVPSVSWDGSSSEDLYIGRDKNNYFKGTIDETRFYGIWLTDAEISDHLQLSGLDGPREKMYLNAHYAMDDTSDTSRLIDSGIYSIHGLVHGGSHYIQSTLDYGRYEVSFPNAR